MSCRLTPKEWKLKALSYLQVGVAPEQTIWTSRDLFAHAPVGQAGTREILIPDDLNELIRTVLCHRDEKKYQLLYRILWRYHHGEPHLLVLKTDADIHKVRMMEKSVRRDMHKMKAFVRFKKTTVDASDIYIAWHEPDHYILRAMAPFFVKRFGSMPWMIITPFQRACWDLKQLTFVDGNHVRPQLADDFEEKWRAYYGSIFNPARVKIKAMKNEMPVRYWKNLPEASLIHELIAKAQSRVRKFGEAGTNEE